MADYRIDTRCIQEGWKPGNAEPRVLPIYQSTTFRYESAEDMAKCFDLASADFFYTRLGNPTMNAVEQKLSSLEGGVGAMLTASGQSASLISVLNICEAGDHAICAAVIYGGTFNLFNKTMRQMGIDFSFVHPDATDDELRAAIKPNTKLIFAESLANPSLVVLDIERFAKVAHEHNIPLIIDNTFPTPVNCRPFEHGADIIVHSTTKYLDGHACTLGGVIIDSGKFDWTKGNFPGLTQPEESYHGLVYTEAFGPAAYIVKARGHLMRDIGPAMSPQNAFLLNHGIETLALRMERHCSNALALAEFLKNHPKVTWVNFPGIEGDKYYELAKRYMPNGTCGVIAFGVKGGREAAVSFQEAVKLAAIVTHVADNRTGLLHPASTTHRQLSEAELNAAGIGADLIRFSCGIEDPRDIIEDVEQALATL